MLRCHNTCEMGKAKRVSFFFPRESPRGTGKHNTRSGTDAGLRFPVSCLCSPAACMHKSSPHSQASAQPLPVDRGGSAAAQSPVYSPCSTHCKETKDKIPMFFYSGGRILLFGHDPCLGLEFVGHYIEPLSYDEYPGGKA